MKKAERLIYHVLAGEVNYLICAFCKYYKCEGGYSPCDCGEGYCTHPLLNKSLNFELEQERAMELGDCWGFRPEHDISFCADIVGIILVNGWKESVWWQNKKGEWRIANIGAN